MITPAVRKTRSLANSLCYPKEDSPPETFKSLQELSSDKSPFTDLVGNCERPSIAPMTPHSRQHLSLLKISLKKQLEDLYD